MDSLGNQAYCKQLLPGSQTLTLHSRPSFLLCLLTGVVSERPPGKSLVSHEAGRERHKELSEAILASFQKTLQQQDSHLTCGPKTQVPWRQQQTAGVCQLCSARRLTGRPLPRNCSITQCPGKSPGPCLPSLNSVCPSVMSTTDIVCRLFPTLVTSDRTFVRFQERCSPDIILLNVPKSLWCECAGPLPRTSSVWKRTCLWKRGPGQCWRSPRACSSVLRLSRCTAGQFWLTGSPS